MASTELDFSKLEKEFDIIDNIHIEEKENNLPKIVDEQRIKPRAEEDAETILRDNIGRANYLLDLMEEEFLKGRCF